MGIVMVRHTTPLIAPGTCYGVTDLDVAESFEQEAETVVANLPAATRIVTSPLQRCRRLADYVSAHTGLSVETDARLIEMNFGSWEGLAWDVIPRSELEAWAADFYHARPHGGESVAALKARVDKAIRDVQVTRLPTLIVTHAGVVRAVLAKGTEGRHFQTEIGFGGMIHLPQSNEVNA